MLVTFPALPADRDSFVARFGQVFEHSPWIAEQAFFAVHASDVDPASLPDLFRKVVLNASKDQQLTLLRAHPELACALARPERLTSASQQEQAGAGLDRCSGSELEEFTRLNRAYREKFGFPFIVAVRGLTRHDILQLFRARVEAEPDEEFRLALEQVCKIGAFRLEALLRD